MSWTIGARILTGLGVMAALTLGLGLYCLFTMAELRAIQTAIGERDLKALETLLRVAQQQAAMRATHERFIGQYQLHKQKGAVQDTRALQSEWHKAKERVESLLRGLQESAAGYEKTAVNASRREQWRRIEQKVTDVRSAWNAFTGEALSLFEQVNQGGQPELAGALAKIDAGRKRFDESIDDCVRLINEQIEFGGDWTQTSYESARTSVILVLLLLLLLAAGSSIAIQRSIAKPLALFAQCVERVGAGDLTAGAAPTGVADLDRLGATLNGMVAGLKELVSKTLTITQNLNAASAEIMTSIQQQAAGTRQQAATVQQITTTMEEVGQSGAQISARARQVAASAEATSSGSSAGLQAVEDSTRLSAAIREQIEEVADNTVTLSEKTQAIGEIIATVTDIAERANLLALNAAIEAAAAGEQGNRFSVVASEMKSLADQAKEATVQVRTILGEIQKRIGSTVMLTEEAVKRGDTGKQQAEIAERTIRHLAQAALDSVQAFEQIIGAGNQQQIGFEQVTQGMKDIRQTTGQTAAATAQLEKAAAGLNALSQQLARSVGRFKL